MRRDVLCVNIHLFSNSKKFMRLAVKKFFHSFISKGQRLSLEIYCRRRLIYGRHYANITTPKGPIKKNFFKEIFILGATVANSFFDRMLYCLKDLMEL